jgi:hypothetical protein
MSSNPISENDTDTDKVTADNNDLRENNGLHKDVF